MLTCRYSPMITASESSPVVLTVSPSHTFNNLSANGSFVCYVHQNEVHLFNESAVGTKKPPNLRKAGIKGSFPISQTKWAKLGDRFFLVISGHQTIEIMESEGVKVLFSFPFPSSEKGAKLIGSGISTMYNGKDYHILCGSSSGEIYAFEVKREIKLIQQLRQHKHAIIDINFDENNPNIWASSDISGKIIVWKSFDIFSLIDIADQQPCTSLAIRGDKLFGAYGSGHVRIWSITRKQKVVEIAAHSQSINALQLHPSKDIFATASDDGLVSLWQFQNATFETTLLVSLPVPNSFITGLQFCGEKQSILVASPYDSHTLPAWQLNLN